MKFGIVVFPGSNCAADCFHVLEQVMQEPVTYLWHGEQELQEVDCIILPGGFSYGDYLRAGALARFSALMARVREFAAKGGLILGIGNGFQILTEAGFLPGALMRNPGLRFQCESTFIRAERTDTPFTKGCAPQEVLQMPIAHGAGSYVADQEVLERIEKEGQVVLRYCNAKGEITPESNPNASMHNIAGMINEKGNILGLMPHPERCAEDLLGGTDGKKIFSSLVNWWQGGAGR